MIDLIQDVAIIMLAISVIVLSTKQFRKRKLTEASISPAQPSNRMLANYIKEQLLTKADRSVYVQVGEVWAVRGKPVLQCAYGTEYSYTLGKKANRYIFTGYEVTKAYELADKWGGKVVDAE